MEPRVSKQFHRLFGQLGRKNVCSAGYPRDSVTVMMGHPRGKGEQDREPQ